MLRAAHAGRRFFHPSNYGVMIYPCNSSHLLGIPNHLHTFSNNFPSRRANNPWWNRIQRIGVSKFYTGNFVYLDGDHSYGYGLIGIWDISCPNFLNHPAMMQRRQKGNSEGRDY